jgi:hypothetical protein
MLRITERPDETRPTEVLLVRIFGRNREDTLILGTYFDPATFARQGMWGTSQIDRGTWPEVVGVVPDGVASVDVRYPRFADRGPGSRVVDHRRRVHRDTDVVDNVFAVTVPRPAQDALPSLLLWRDAAGTVARIFRR